MLTDLTITKFLDELASNSPAPGGGSVAALAGATGAALASMVCNLTIGKKKYADVQAEMNSVLQKSERLRQELTQLINKDTEAFNGLMSAFGLPKGTEQEQLSRTAAIQNATKAATLVPLRVMEICQEALHCAKRVAEKGNKNSVSDAGVAALMLQASCAGAALNVRINLGSLQDSGFVKDVTQKTSALLTNAETLAHDTLAEVEKSLKPA